MRPYITILLLVLAIFKASAQEHIADIKQTAHLYAEAYLKQDYNTILKYMYPKRIAYWGGPDKLVKEIQDENQQSLAQNITVKNLLIGEPGPVARYGTMLYSVVPDTIIIRYMNKADMGTASSFVAISDNDGKSWTLATVENLPWLTSVLPDIAKLNIPKTVQLGILTSGDKPDPVNGKRLVYLGRRALAMVVVTNDKEFLADTNSIKVVKEKWIKSTTIGGFEANPNDTTKYGKDAANGVNRYIIDDKKYPKAYLEISKALKYVGPADPGKNN